MFHEDNLIVANKLHYFYKTHFILMALDWQIILIWLSRMMISAQVFEASVSATAFSSF